MPWRSACRCLIAVVVTATPALVWAASLEPGGRAEVTVGAALAVEAGATAVTLQAGDTVSIDMIYDVKAMVRRDSDGASGWISVKYLKAIAGPARPVEQAQAQVRTRSSRQRAPAADGTVVRPLRVAVYEFGLDGVDPKVGLVASDSLLAEVRKLQGVSAIGMAEIRDMLSLEATKQMIGCEADESCLAEIGGALGVDEIVTGRLTSIQGTNVVAIRRINQNEGKIEGTFDQRFKDEGGQEFLAALGPAVAKLYSRRPLRHGQSRGVSKEVALRLDPPPLPPWSFWTVSGLAGVSLAASGMAATALMFAYNDYAQYLSLSTSQLIDGATLKQKAALVQQTNIITISLIGATAAVGLTAGIMAPFVDWQGYGEAMESMQVSSSR